MQYLKADTAIDVRIGQAVDATDGVTPETTLALGTADQAELLKHNGAATIDISARTFAAVTGCDGWYDLSLTVADTDTEGMLTVVIQDSSLMLPVFKDFMVLEANAYDSLVPGTDTLHVDVQELVGQTTSAAQFESSTANIITGSAQTGTLTDIEFSTSIGGTYTADDGLNGRILTWDADTTTSALRGQAQYISDYAATNGVITVGGPFTVAPSNGDTFTIT